MMKNIIIKKVYILYNSYKLHEKLYKTNEKSELSERTHTVTHTHTHWTTHRDYKSIYY
jgi:hypothetical protein